MAPDDTMETTRIKASLNRLAGPDEATAIERGAESVQNVESAAKFLEVVGFDQLIAAVAATDDQALEARGRRTLETYRRFHRAAVADPSMEEDYFHRGHGTALRRDGEPHNR